MSKYVKNFAYLVLALILCGVVVGGCGFMAALTSGELTTPQFDRTEQIDNIASVFVYNQNNYFVYVKDGNKLIYHNFYEIGYRNQFNIIADVEKDKSMYVLIRYYWQYGDDIKVIDIHIHSENDLKSDTWDDGTKFHNKSKINKVR